MLMRGSAEDKEP